MDRGRLATRRAGFSFFEFDFFYFPILVARLCNFFLSDDWFEDSTKGTTPPPSCCQPNSGSEQKSVRGWHGIKVGRHARFRAHGLARGTDSRATGRQ
jgi:hypothetical protein